MPLDDGAACKLEPRRRRRSCRRKGFDAGASRLRGAAGRRAGGRRGERGPEERAPGAARAVRAGGQGDGLPGPAGAAQGAAASAPPTTSPRPGRGSSSAATSTASATTCSPARNNAFTGQDRHRLQRAHRPGRRGPAGDRPRLQGQGPRLGGGRRRELRRGQLARARRHVRRATSACRGGAGPQLRPHPRDQPQEAGGAAADLRRPGRLRADSPGRPPELSPVSTSWRPGRPVDRRNLHHADGQREIVPGPAQPHRRADRLVHGRFGAEPDPHAS
ncbi:MAG: hypothetical protein MZW92_51290 [Comamonadaceae bacterium]|nr:hypothetical protein [Comamonadaceae bacterium]